MDHHTWLLHCVWLHGWQDRNVRRRYFHSALVFGTHSTVSVPLQLGFHPNLLFVLEGNVVNYIFLVNLKKQHQQISIYSICFLFQTRGKSANINISFHFFSQFSDNQDRVAFTFPLCVKNSMSFDRVQPLYFSQLLGLKCVCHGSLSWKGIANVQLGSILVGPLWQFTSRWEGSFVSGSWGQNDKSAKEGVVPLLRDAVNGLTLHESAVITHSSPACILWLFYLCYWEDLANNLMYKRVQITAFCVGCGRR